MFLQQTMRPWFAIQRASQVTMILLALAMLVLPVLTQPEEAEAALLVCVVGGCFAIVAAIAGVCAHCYITRCQGPCGGWGIGTGHLVSCKASHNYYYCMPNSAWQHATCS